MLKYRIVTSLILLIFILLCIWLLPMSWFSILMGVIIVYGGWEWFALAGIKNSYIRGFYVVLLSTILWTAYYLPIFWVLISALIVWLWVIAAVVCYALGIAPLGLQYPVVKIILGFFALVPCWLAVTTLREDIDGLSWLIFGLLLVVAMDTGAYAAGRLWGKHKLTVRVSPNKTWEGLGGGFILTLSITLMTGILSRFSLYQLSILTLLALVTGFFAVIGDLFESMLKRQAGIKDSGRLLPGHGGILDRIDSLIGALPVLALGSLLMSG